MSAWAGPVVAAYFLVLGVLAVFGAHHLWMVFQYWRFRHRNIPRADAQAPELPEVLIQLPLYNEPFVAERLIDAAVRLRYPADRLEIQVLDDSTDETPEIVARAVARWRAAGLRVSHVRRDTREGYKAGALAHGLELSRASLIAVFDADFVPGPDFLERTVDYFNDPRVGMVQTRWDHLNREESLLTRVQSILLDGHFVVEHLARSRSGCFFNFNGTAGIWRRAAIEQAGGWQHDTLTEDLDLSYRAQAIGWRFVFLTDVTTPGEVPVGIEDFKTQQHRWTKGAIQTCRKLLWSLWRGPIPLRCKIEAGFHLLANFSYLLMVVLSGLLGPTVLARSLVHWEDSPWPDVILLSLTSTAVSLFYLHGQFRIGRGFWRTLPMIPLVMSLGIGISLSNAWAVIEGLFQRGGEFVRTPKFRRDGMIHDPGLARRRKSCREARRRWLIWVEWTAFVYSLALTGFCLSRGQWTILPFLAMFVLGYGYVAVASTINRWGERFGTAAGAS